MKSNKKLILHILFFWFCLGINVALAMIMAVEVINLEFLLILIVCIICSIMKAVSQIFRFKAADYYSYIPIFLSYLLVFSVTFYINYNIYVNVSITKGIIFTAIALIELAIISVIHNHDKIKHKFYSLFEKKSGKKETNTLKPRNTNNK